MQEIVRGYVCSEAVWGQIRFNRNQLEPYSMGLVDCDFSFEENEFLQRI